MQDYAIVFVYDESPLAAEICAALRELGLFRDSTNTVTPDLISALNTYRRANSLTELEFCDPVTLRTLGIDAHGDELLVLARAAQTLGQSEMEYFDICRKIVKESRELDITVTEAAARYGVLGAERGSISETAVRCAALSLLHE